MPTADLTPERLAAVARAVGLKNAKPCGDGILFFDHGDIHLGDVDTTDPATVRLWAFKRLAPVLLRARWTINLTGRWTRCAPPMSGFQVVARSGVAGMQKDASFALALVAAVEWLQANQPSVLARAVEQIGKVE